MDLWRRFIGHGAVGFERGESSRRGTIVFVAVCVCVCVCQCARVCVCENASCFVCVV